MRVRCACRLFSLLEHAAQPGEPVWGGAVVPVRVFQEGREHRAMDMSVLSQVDRGQVEAERLDAAQQALHTEQSGMLSPVRAEARDHQTEIPLQLRGGAVAFGRRCIAPGRLEPRRDQAK